MKILVVDDTKSIRKSISELLELLGHSVYAASDGVEALALYLAHESEIDLVISDIDMPKMNGVQLFHALREIDPEVRAVFMSGEDSYRGRMLAEGAIAFLGKPFHLPDLEKALALVSASMCYREQSR